MTFSIEEFHKNGLGESGGARSNLFTVKVVPPDQVDAEDFAQFQFLVHSVTYSSDETLIFSIYETEQMDALRMLRRLSNQLFPVSLSLYPKTTPADELRPISEFVIEPKYVSWSIDLDWDSSKVASWDVVVMG